MSRTELAAPLLRLNDGLIAGPKEVFLSDSFHQPAAFHYVICVIMNSSEHQRATLLV